MENQKQVGGGGGTILGLQPDAPHLKNLIENKNCIIYWKPDKWGRGAFMPYSWLPRPLTTKNNVNHRASADLGLRSK